MSTATNRAPGLAVTRWAVWAPTPQPTSGTRAARRVGGAGDYPSSGPLTTEPGLDIFDAMRAVPARVDLTPGVPDLAAFPRTAWLRAERTVLSDLSASAFGYGDPAGTPSLRLAVANWLARNRGIRVDSGDIIIVAGVAQALGLTPRSSAAKASPRWLSRTRARSALVSTCSTGG